MDVTYNASSATKRSELITYLARQGYDARETKAPMAWRWPIRVWRVEPADEQKVVEMILSVDAQARPVIPPPSYTHI